MKIGVVQLTSVLDPQINLNKIKQLVGQKKLDALFLPECFYSVSDGINATPFLVSEGNIHLENIKQLARDLKCALIGGSAATQVGNQLFNRTYNINSDGELMSFYDKVHLFSCDLSNHESKKVLDEKRLYSSGKKKNKFKFNDFVIGNAICFDIRFPEFFRSYFQDGVNLYSAASAFTVPTGKAHWHTLIRARAIENQSYVIAAAQWGKHNTRMETFGHSLVVDPWGEVIWDGGEGEKFTSLEIDIQTVQVARARLSVAPNIFSFS